MSRKKIALVNQRYGLEVNGGSEFYTRLLADQLMGKYDVEVLTTTALDYDTWDNYYEEGLQRIDGIPVRRFSVDRKRSRYRFSILTRVLRLIKSTKLEERWLDAQGPVSEGLIQYIAQNKESYDVFIFVTYLYYHTAKGLPLAAEKSVLIPTAHEEPYIYYSIYKNIFQSAKAIIYLTEEEKSLVQGIFHNAEIPSDVIGIGVDLPQTINDQGFRQKYKIEGHYLIYVGRIDVEKGCNELFRYFMRYQLENPLSGLKLILAGKTMMEVPVRKDIRSLGFIEEKDKFSAISGARALVLPSEHESLSIAVLEAMALSVPVLVNGRCAVLKGHCRKSNGGLYYEDYDSFRDGVGQLSNDDERYQSMKHNARSYIEANYTWDVAMKKFDSIIEKI